MNSSTTEASHWNTSPSMMSFVGSETNTQKPFWDWETNTTTTIPTNDNHTPFMNPSTSFYDYYSLQTHIPPTYSINPEYQTGYPKREDGCSECDVGNYTSARIGLNLGHRTYFSSRESAVIDRLFKRSRGFYQANQVPICQAEGCKTDLTNAKRYHRRHKVCEFHSKATKVLAGGLEQRFCQQCSRFHVLAEFDEVKRSCRKRLADHNRRRRKPQPGSSADTVATSAATKTAEISTDERRQTEKSTLATANEMFLSSSHPLVITKGKDQAPKDHYFQNQHYQIVTGKSQNSPTLSLGGIENQMRYPHHQPFSSSSVCNRGSVFGYSNQNMFYSNSNEASACQSTAEHSQQQQQPEELQNLLHLGRAMFEVELL